MNEHSDGKVELGQATGTFEWEKPATEGAVAEKNLAAGGNFRLAVQPGWNALLTQKTFDEKHRWRGQRPRAEGSRERQFALVGDLLNVHASGLGMIHGKGEPAFPIVHSVVRAMLLLGIRHRLRKAPYFPLQILRHAGGVEPWLVLGDTGNHMIGSNDS